MNTRDRQVYGLFNDSFPPVLDGVTLTVENYVRWLTEAGRRVAVVTPWCPGPLEHKGFDVMRYFSLPIYNRHPYRYGYPRFDPLIWRKIRHTPFRIVHAHSPFSSGRLAAYAARKHDIPLVATFHSKYRTDLDRSLPPFMVRYQMQRILKFYEAASEVWIPQAAVEDTLREYGYRGPVRVVDNGNDFGEGIPDIEAYKHEAREAFGIPSGRLALLFVGQHILEKGVEVIIMALSKLPQALDWQMDFIGTGYAAEQMKTLVCELGLADRVTFHGVINNREELRRHYAAADLFLFPSFYDNAPLVVREAAAMLTPSILLEGSTSAELVTDGHSGYLIQRTPEAYAAAISRLASDRPAILSVGRGARQALCRPWHNVIDEVMELYEEIIQRHHAHE